MLPKTMLLEYWQGCEDEVQTLEIVDNPSDFQQWLTQSDFGMEVYERLMAGNYGRNWDALSGFFEQCEDVGQLGLIVLWKRFDKSDPNYSKITNGHKNPASYLAMWAACKGRDSNTHARRRHHWNVEVEGDQLEDELVEYIAPKEVSVIHRPVEDEALSNIEAQIDIDERLVAINQAIELAKVATTNNLKMYRNLDIVVESLKHQSISAQYNEAAQYYRALDMSYFTYSRWKSRLVPHLKEQLISRLPHLA